MRITLAALFVAFGFVACAAPTATSMSTLPSERSARSVVGGEFLYVASANAGVSVYPLGATVPVRTLSAKLPTAMAFDRSGNLYVANHNGGPSGRGYVSVYAPGSSAPLRTISNGVNVPYSLAFDSKGNLYVANYIRALNSPNSQGSVTVYEPNADSPFRTISGVEHPHQIAIDSKDDLYVAELTHLHAYAPDAAKPTRTLGYTNPLAIGVDSKNRLYAGFWEGCPMYCDGGIEVFDRGKTKPTAEFELIPGDPGVDVTGFAFDSLGDFVFSASNWNIYGPPHFGGGVQVWPGAVAVYPTLHHHDGRNRYWISKYYNLAPSAVIVDSSDTIIVGSNGSVVAFADFERNSPPLYTITQGISGQVTALAIASH